MHPNAIHTIKTQIKTSENQITNQKHVLLADPEVDSESTDHRRGKEVENQNFNICNETKERERERERS
jgi:hypothetical protein